MYNLDIYKTLASQNICQATMVYDLARSAEKLVDPNCVGQTNPAWEEGPYLSSPQNMPQIPREYPYCLRVSIESQAAFNIAYTGKVESSPYSREGKLQLPLPENNGSRVNPYIAKAIIIEQFELLKDFLSYINAPTNEKQTKKYVGILNETYIEALITLVKRRNELTHEIDAPKPTLKESIEFHYTCLWLANNLNREAQNNVFKQVS